MTRHAPSTYHEAPERVYALPEASQSELGIVYLICFDEPYPVETVNGVKQERRHYVGWTRDASTLTLRLRHHANGRGSKLLGAVARAGIAFRVVRTWEGADKHFERKLHRLRKLGNLCPHCHRLAGGSPSNPGPPTRAYPPQGRGAK